MGMLVGVVLSTVVGLEEGFLVGAKEVGATVG